MSSPHERPVIPPDTADCGAFSAAANVGRGLAPLHLLECQDRGAHRATLDVLCDGDPAYDPQCEPARAPFSFGLFQISGDPERYRRRLLTRLREITDDGEGNFAWDLTYLVEMSVLFAREWDDEARTVARSRFDDLVEHFGWDGGWYLADLDGIAGLIELIERTWSDTSEPWKARGLLDRAGEQFTADEVAAQMAAAASTSPAVASFCRLAGTPDEPSQRGEVSTVRYVTVRRPLVDGGVVVMPHPQSIERFSNDELAMAAADITDLLTADQPTEAMRRSTRQLLRIFRRHPWPTNPHVLMDAVRSRPPADNLVLDVATPAAAALARLATPELRTFAIDLIGDPDRLLYGTEILATSGRPDDGRLFLDAFTSSTDRHTRHAIGMDILDAHQADAIHDLDEALMALYIEGPCGSCRHRVVKALSERGDLPGWIIQECAHDCDPDTRALVG